MFMNKKQYQQRFNDLMALTDEEVARQSNKRSTMDNLKACFGREAAIKICYERPEYEHRLTDLINQRKLTPTLQSAVKQRYDYVSESRMSSDVLRVYTEELREKYRDSEANRCRAYIDATF